MEDQSVQGHSMGVSKSYLLTPKNYELPKKEPGTNRIQMGLCHVQVEESRDYQNLQQMSSTRTCTSLKLEYNSMEAFKALVEVSKTTERSCQSCVSDRLQGR